MVDFQDVARAAARLEGKVRRTEVTYDAALGERRGAEVCFKWESRQITARSRCAGG